MALPRLSLLLTDLEVLTVSAIDGVRLEGGPMPKRAVKAGDIGGLFGPDGTLGNAENVP